LSATEGEIKSMRTPSALRRTGTGKALLSYIIDVARSRGYRTLYLETGRNPAFMPAQALYRRAGFALCGPFGTSPRSLARARAGSIFMRWFAQDMVRSSDAALRPVNSGATFFMIFSSC
jgi:L-amino acid N-acyltransferase YncA